MSSVIFYGIKSEFFPIASKIVEKLYVSKERVLFLCDNEEEVNFYNAKLWTFSKLLFIPSGNKRTISNEDAKFCYVWFSTSISFDNDPTCLIHNGLDITSMSSIEKFEKIIDIFNIDLLNAAKIRAVFYKEKGLINQKLWIQSETSWKQGEL